MKYRTLQLTGIALALTLLAVAGLSGCSSEENADPTPDGDEETSSADGDESPTEGDDAAIETGEESATETAEESGEESLPTCADCNAYPEDPLADKIIIQDDPGTCEKPLDWPTLSTDSHKFAMNLLHFNLQYAAGGIKGFAGTDPDDPESPFYFGEFEVEDLIIRESFVPIIDFYLAHPTWRATVELQGYMIEAMAKRFPEALDNLRILVNRRQIELVSFHWSDQLFLAFPHQSMEHSLTFTDKSFAGHCLAPGRSVFSQEGQYAPDMASLMPQHNRNILMLPTNLYKYYHVTDHAAGIDPYYKLSRYPDVDIVIVGKGIDNDSLNVTWTFFNDGELLATNELNPYFGTMFVYSEKAMEKYAAKLQNLEDQGYQHITVTQYVNWLKAKNITPTELPATHGGIWQPRDTQNIHLWMGGCYLETVCTIERDNEIRTRNYASGKRLRAVGVVLDWMETLDADYSTILPELRAQYERAWRYQLLAEVSDATAWNPFTTEIDYTKRYDGLANDIATAIMQRVEFYTGKSDLAVDLAAATVTPDTPPAATPDTELTPIEDSAAPVTPLITTDAPAGRSEIHQWYKDTTNPKRFVLEVSFSAASANEEEFGKQLHGVYVTFPRASNTVYYTPALLDNEVQPLDLDDYDFQQGETSVPLVNGLIGIADDVWVIADIRYLHIAPLLHMDKGDVEFYDESQPFAEDVTWRFEVWADADSATALARARALNSYGVVRP